MRRALLLTAVVGGFLAGVGCKHVAGRCDCTADPADAVLPVPSNPYPAVGAPLPGGPVTAAPAEAMPPPGR
jgi:hypothetical protein